VGGDHQDFSGPLKAYRDFFSHVNEEFGKAVYHPCQINPNKEFRITRLIFTHEKGSTMIHPSIGKFHDGFSAFHIDQSPVQFNSGCPYAMADKGSPP
jgi:hypothetical protein